VDGRDDDFGQSALLRDERRDVRGEDAPRPDGQSGDRHGDAGQPSARRERGRPGAIAHLGDRAGGAKLEELWGWPEREVLPVEDGFGAFPTEPINDNEDAFVQQNILVANSAGNVGIGTDNPVSKLSVEGSGYTVGATASPYYEGFRVRASDFSTNGGYLLFGKQNGSGYGVIQAGDNAAARNIVLNPSGGNVGIGPGMTTPAEALMVNGNISVHRGASPGPAELRVYNGGQIAEWAFRQSSATSHDLKISKSVGGVYTDYLTVSTSGNVGIGTQPTTHTLEVGGTISATGAITGATVNATYQDVAEWVPSIQKLSAGTVVVLDTNQTNHVLASTSAYDTKVAGVVSARPGIALGEGGDGKALVATTGRVRVKADATRAPSMSETCL
jgi:hypothetical protein